MKYYLLFLFIVLLLSGCANYPAREDLTEIPQYPAWTEKCTAAGMIEVDISPEHINSPMAQILREKLSERGYSIFENRPNLPFEQRLQVKWIIEPSLELSRNTRLENNEHATDLLVVFSIRPASRVVENQIVRGNDIFIPVWSRHIIPTGAYSGEISTVLYEQVVENLISLPEFRNLVAR